MITSEELVRVLEMLSRMWPDRMEKALASLGSPADLLHAFSAWTVEELEDAARGMILHRKRLFDSDNPIALLRESASKARADSGGAAVHQVAVPFSVDPSGRVGHIRPEDLDRCRQLHEEATLDPTLLGPIVDAARRWEASYTPCRRCQREPGHCHACRREHEPINCSRSERDTASRHLEEWLDEAWATRQSALCATAKTRAAAVARWRKAMVTRDRAKRAAIPIAEVVGEISTRRKVVEAATLPPRTERRGASS